MYILGFDIGGTKCAVITATWDGEKVTLLKKEKCETLHTISGEEMLERLIALAEKLLDGKPDAIGISSGGPLDEKAGVILSPPNLPRWRDVPVTRILEAHFGVRAYLKNDANACALAEWRFGAGEGCEHMIFLTFGTGLGAGIIANGRLYSGANGGAGEVGHVRLAEDGPVGYGKSGSFEGFCSGGGIARLGVRLAEESLKAGKRPLYFPEGAREADVSAKSIADAAHMGDETAKEVYRIAGEYLGRGLSLLIDVLNPERIVIGSIFARNGELLKDAMQRAIEREALPISKDACRILPAALGESIGDYAAIAAVFM